MEVVICVNGCKIEKPEHKVHEQKGLVFLVHWVPTAPRSLPTTWSKCPVNTCWERRIFFTQQLLLWDSKMMPHKSKCPNPYPAQYMTYMTMKVLDGVEPRHTCCTYVACDPHNHATVGSSTLISCRGAWGIEQIWDSGCLTPQSHTLDYATSPLGTLSTSSLEV